LDDREREAISLMREHGRQGIAWAREGRARWTEDPKTVAAVAYAVGQVGEAVRRVSTATRAAHADVAWAAISGMRNRIYHEYGSLDVAILRETVARDLPALLKRLDAILEQ
jgi:uncharacterized protein with HEPN domain